MDPEGIVTLYAQTGAMSSAFAVAQTLDADMTPLFEDLAGKCISLARSGPGEYGCVACAEA